MPMQVNVEGRGEKMNLVRNKRGTGAQAFGVEGKKRTQRVRDSRGETMGASRIQE
jgi:hypothetical protein